MSTRTCLLLSCLTAAVVLGGCGGGGGGPASSTLSKSRHAKGLSEDYTVWQESVRNPILGPDTNSAFPCVLQDGSRLLMWTDNESGGVYLRTSSDGGSNWSSASACSGLRSGARHARVLLNAALASYEMWYWDGSNDYSFGSFYRARSADGLTWTSNTACATLGSSSGHRTVYTLYGANIASQGPAQVFYNGGTATSLNYTDPWQNQYLMYYHLRREKDGKSGINVAVSNDGLTWGAVSEGGMVLEPGASGEWDSKSATMGAIFRQNGLYHMYYAGGATYSFGGDGIGYASSADGLTWVKAAAPIMSTSDGVAWRAHYLGPPAALLVDGLRTLFIYVWDGSDRLIGLARVPDSEPPVIGLSASAETIACTSEDTTASVTISGSATDSDSGLAAVTLTVTDEYGTASQAVDLLPALDSATGAFSYELTLDATIHSDDADGRTYTISLGASDARGNVATAQVVQVTCERADAEPPVVALESDLTILWPPTGEDVAVKVSGSATDAGSSLATLTLSVDDEYDEADREIDLLPAISATDGTFEYTVNLTASRRRGDENGREYVLTLSATDSRGNAADPVSLSVVCPQRYPAAGQCPGHGRPHGPGHGGRPGGAHGGWPGGGHGGHGGQGCGGWGGGRGRR